MKYNSPAYFFGASRRQQAVRKISSKYHSPPQKAKGEFVPVSCRLEAEAHITALNPRLRGDDEFAFPP